MVGPLREDRGEGGRRGEGGARGTGSWGRGVRQTGSWGWR